MTKENIKGRCCKQHPTGQAVSVFLFLEGATLRCDCTQMDGTETNAASWMRRNRRITAHGSSLWQYPYDPIDLRHIEVCMIIESAASLTWSGTFALRLERFLSKCF